MAIESIKEFRQQSGVVILKIFIKPTAKFPEGKNFWYAPVETLGLVRIRSWCLNKSGNRVQVKASINDYIGKRGLLFHKELYKQYHGCDWQGCIDHINMVEIDNTDENLNAVTSSQNQMNRYTRGYLHHKSRGWFQSKITLNGENLCLDSITYREDEACTQQNYLEQVRLRELMQDDYYQFDFKKYRRDSEDILDLERTGIISEEEATYRHILKYSSNAWYYLRFGLQEFFHQYNIPIPSYSLDTNGFMVHPITGQRLCPFT